ncbi:putative bifunctional diguanylate cyclase/phosphodiesterase [Halalkalibacter urbisdiaboli]|uniref:putative bifunctional diguanylate cyclase/phosphodiesterase n=1 Tax=Halalkalibacter urbisdiaboli TaxID=1960589 RepID=UPI000B453B56|nr:EAL domain-containing protein [Halalkalibacter urbisdiaboli]
MKLSELKKRLRESEQQYQSLVHFNPNAIFILTRSGSFLHVNPATTNITGQPEEVLLKMNFENLVNVEERPLARQNFRLALNGEANTFEIELMHQTGQSLFANVTLMPNQIDGNIEGVIGIAQDITKRKLAELKISKIANEDALTQLPNRRYVLDSLEVAIKQAKKVKQQIAVLFIDLDRFKLVNDTLGHFFGDHALKMIAERLKKGLSSKDVLARMGGDEFIVYLPELTSPLMATDVAERILKIIRKPLIVDGYEFTITACIGIAIFPDNGSTAESLIRSADAAMYRAKANGSDGFELYNRNMNEDISKLFNVENDLRKALERNEFKLYFQPQFDTRTGKLCGEEVLVRWNHPDNGLLSPSRFISIAEETGLIIPIGDWILREACKQKASWIHAGYPNVPMSVNISSRQFLQVRFVHFIETILEETGLPPEYLDLEVTESVAIDIERTLGVLTKLTQLGIHISLDDFGTGYSSLQYISQLPIQELKIDQSFVQGIGKGQNSEEIIAMIINLAHLLKLFVIAEGVETKEQLHYLANQGCDRIQGFLHSEPLSIEHYEQFLKLQQ